jgi:mutual gliding-motility protein MglA
VAQVDFAERQVTLKIVYWGPPHSGKTSNLRSLHAKVDSLNRGRLMTIDTRNDRTLFFDLLPLFFRSSGFSFRIKVYTVPGQPAHEATRRVVLSGADGVVFVADSTPEQNQCNRESWHNLQRNLLAQQLTIPVVVQYNKRDRQDALPLDQLEMSFDSELDTTSAKPSIIAAAALAGVGVVETFLAISEQIWSHLDIALGLADRFGISRDVFVAEMRKQIGSAILEEGL